MTTRGKFGLAAVVLVTLAAGGAWREMKATQVAREALGEQGRQLAAARRRVDALESELRGATDAGKAGRDRVQQLEAELAAATGMPAKTVAPELRAKPGAVAHPAESEAHFRAMLPIRFRTLWRELQLTPEQIVAFENILAEADRQQSVTFAAKDGGTLDSADAQKAFASAQHDRDEALTALLGPAGFAKFQQANGPKNTEANVFVSTLAGDLYASDTPLTGSQGDQLRQLIVHNTQFVKKPLPNSAGQSTYSVPQTDWSVVESSSAGFLSPGQQSALELRAVRYQVSGRP